MTLRKNRAAVPRIDALRRAPAKVRAAPARLARAGVFDTRRAGDAGRSAATGYDGCFARRMSDINANSS